MQFQELRVEVPSLKLEDLNPEDGKLPVEDAAASIVRVSELSKSVPPYSEIAISLPEHVVDIYKRGPEVKPAVPVCAADLQTSAALLPSSNEAYFQIYVKKRVFKIFSKMFNSSEEASASIEWDKLVDPMAQQDSSQSSLEDQQFCSSRSRGRSGMDGAKSSFIARIRARSGTCHSEGLGKRMPKWFGWG